MSKRKKNNIGQTEAIWDREWEIYNKNPYFKPNYKVIKIIKECFGNNLKGKKIIELGAGSGSDVVCLASAGARGVALDFSQESIHTIKHWAKKKKVKIEAIKADIKKIPYPDHSFDMVYSVGLIEHFKNPLTYLKEQIRLVKPGGFLLIDVPQKYTLYTLMKHIRMKLKTHPFGWETEFSKADLIRLARKLNQPVYRIYGRDSDVISRLPSSIRPFCNKIYLKYLEGSFFGPHISLVIGLVLRVDHRRTGSKRKNKNG